MDDVRASLNPDVAYISNIIIDVTFVVSSIIFPLMIWLIFCRSQTLGKYRWYMLTNVSLCYLFDFWLTLVKPVFVGPVLGWYLQGFVPASSSASRWWFVVGWFCMNSMDLSVVASLFYRYSQAYFNWLREFFESPKVYVAYMAVVAAVYAYAVPIVFADGDDSSTMSAGLNGFFAYPRTRLAEMYLISVALILFGFMMLGNVLYLVFLVRLRSGNFMRSQSKASYRLQMMLFRTISVQLFLGYVLLLLPALFAVLITALGSPNSGSIATMLATAMSFHASLDYLVICYFVMPYRRAILRILGRSTKNNDFVTTVLDGTTIVVY